MIELFACDGQRNISLSGFSSAGVHMGDRLRFKGEMRERKAPYRAPRKHMRSLEDPPG